MRKYLTAVQIEHAKTLRQRGLPKAAIARAFTVVYREYSRNVVYRHLNDDPAKYRMKPEYRIHKEKPPEYHAVQALKREDLTSTQVAERLGLELRVVNRLWAI